MKLTVENVEFELEDVLQNLSNQLGLRASDKGLELLFQVSTLLPETLVGDALRLGQILLNLVGNQIVDETTHRKDIDWRQVGR